MDLGLVHAGDGSKTVSKNPSGSITACKECIQELGNGDPYHGQRQRGSEIRKKSPFQRCELLLATFIYSLGREKRCGSRTVASVICEKIDEGLAGRNLYDLT
jgi:hypothetical protein